MNQGGIGPVGTAAVAVFVAIYIIVETPLSSFVLNLALAGVFVVVGVASLKGAF